jgi:hypothetical protein
MGGGSPAVVSYGNGTMSAPVVGNYDFYIDHDGNPILNDTIT